MPRALISHHTSTAALQWHALRAFSFGRVLDVASATPARSFVEKNAHDTPLARLVTKRGGI